jgi:hypothetical protein
LKKRGLKDADGKSVPVDEAFFWQKVNDAVCIGTAAMLPILRSAYCRAFNIEYENLCTRPQQAWQIIGLVLGVF